MAEYVPGRSLRDGLKSTTKSCDSCKVRNHQLLEAGDTLTCSCDVCEKHEGEVITFYCKTHQVVGCVNCMVLEHRQCGEMCTLDEIATRDACLVKHRNLSVAIADIKQDLSKQIKISNENWRTVESDRANAINKIDELQNKLLHKLKMLKLKVVKETECKERNEAYKLKEVMATANKMEDDIKYLEKDLKDHEEMQQGQHFFIAMTKAEEFLGRFDIKLDNLKEENEVERFGFAENPTLLKLMHKVETFGEIQTPDAEKSNVNVQCLLVHLYR